MTDFESLISSLARSALTSKDATVAWPWRLFAGLVATLGLLWLRWQLGQKEKELARARADLEREQFQSKWDLVKAHVGTLDLAAEQAAREALTHANAALAGLGAAEAAFQAQKSAVEKLASFEDLNRFAGVAP
jgi:hypothetical protein